MAASGNTNNRFAATCARMRQFLLEQNRQMRMGNLVVGSSPSFQRPLQLTPVPVPVATGPAGSWDTGATTLSLFPVGTGTEIIRPEEANASTLTIFYQGQVATFPNFPADKAKVLMQMAGSVTGKAPEMGVTTTAMAGKAETSDEEPAADMPPIARKLTLQRFLRKRKNRIVDDPDNNGDASPQKKRDTAGASNDNPAEDMLDDASWLRL